MFHSSFHHILFRCLGNTVVISAFLPSFTLGKVSTYPRKGLSPEEACTTNVKEGGGQQLCYPSVTNEDLRYCKSLSREVCYPSVLRSSASGSSEGPPCASPVPAAAFPFLGPSSLKDNGP